MKIRTGLKLLNNLKEIEGNSVVFVTEDGEELFEISIVDEKSIRVRGIEPAKINGVLYTEYLQITPQTANSVVVSTKIYE